MYTNCGHQLTYVSCQIVIDSHSPRWSRMFEIQVVRQVKQLLRIAPDIARSFMPKFRVDAPHATASEGLIQGPYVAFRAEFEPVTLRTKGVESANEPRVPQNNVLEQSE